MIRLEDWPEKLHEVIESARGRRFEWGVHDCTTFSADCVLAMTGVDYAADVRGKYKTAKGAKSIIAKKGGVEAIATGIAGEAISPLMARRGDGVMYNDALGICLGVTCAFVSFPEGLTFVPLSMVEKAWRI